MLSITSWLEKILIMTSILFLLPIVLLTFVLLAIFTRLLFIIVMTIAIPGTMLYVSNHNFQNWVNDQLYDPFLYKDIRLVL